MMPTLQVIQNETAKPKQSGHHPVSYIFLAVIFLTVTDLSARVLYKCRPDLWPVSAYDSPNRSQLWWATNDLRKLKQAPEVVLFGSSLINTAVVGAEATYLNKPVDACLNHRSTYLENQLSLAGQEKQVVFSFAIPGQMASDAYALASTLLHGKLKPKAIIWGIAPRDFLDCELTDATSTDTYKYMSRLRNLNELRSLSVSSFWDIVARDLSELSFLYDHKSDFVFLQHKFLNQFIAKLEHKNMDLINLPFALRKDALYEFMEDRAARELLIRPYDPNHQLFADNTREYRWRYREFRPKVFSTQLSCLALLTKYAHDNGVALYVVNMPLLPENLALLSESTYRRYLNQVSDIVTDGGGNFVNLQNPTIAQKQNYLDSAHLNGLGGQKLLDNFAQILNQSSQLASTSDRQL